MTPICQYLEWDTDFFGCRIARVVPNKLDRNDVEAVLKWCEEQKIDCLYFLADIDDDFTVRLAEENRFHFVDVRLTFEKKLSHIPSNLKQNNDRVIRLSRSEDIIDLKTIARISYHKTRFYYDSNFPVHLVDHLYETWIEKSCNGYADIVLVAEIEQRAVGYISCHRIDQVNGQIGLVGVHPDCKGKGIGRALVNQSLNWFAAQGNTRVRVVTQGRNYLAQKVYEICGFLTVGMQIWYHVWFQDKK
jgi:dTDP-4-amino-4,6-dideoxy-D-galactose acyltransferase